MQSSRDKRDNFYNTVGRKSRIFNYFLQQDQGCSRFRPLFEDDHCTKDSEGISSAKGIYYQW